MTAVKRVSITIWVESEEEAKDVMARLYRKHETWPELIEKDTPPPKSSTAVPEAKVAARANVSPGEPTITKIGKDTKAALLADIAHDGSQPVAKWAEHMKLLWKRGEVKFDGEDYYS